MSIVFDSNDPRLKELPQIIEQATRDVVIECLDQAVWIAKALVPVMTGALRMSIRREGLSFCAGDGGIINPRTRREVDYAVFVEAEYPFMKASWSMASTGIEDKIKQRILTRLGK